MICHLCKEDKLSNEFPFDPLTEYCDHPLLHCLDCVTASVKNYKKCSQCENVVKESNEKYQEYLETLDFLFPNVDEDEAILSNPAAGVSSSQIVTVTTLAGECTTLPYSPYKNILSLKKEIETKLKILPTKQRLLYQNTELKTKNWDHQLSTLKDYNVPPNGILHLIILLCAVPDEMDNAIFDFHWGYPSHRRDYLDVSVFIYSGSNCIDVVDYRRRESYSCPGVVHSGPAEMDDYARRGHHKVNVSLKSIPDHVDNLVFTMSAWRSANISQYPSPSLRFYDANSPDKQLCNDEMSNAGHCRAIIMCSLSRKGGQWVTVSLKVGSSGFTRDYSPLKINISRLIRNSYI